MKEKKGISLIVLIVTIIVMIIIAGAVIISLTETNVIDQAETAVEKHNISEIETAASLAHANWLLESKTSNTKVPQLQNYIRSELIKQNVVKPEEMNKYYITQEGTVEVIEDADKPMMILTVEVPKDNFRIELAALEVHKDTPNYTIDWGDKTIDELDMYDTNPVHTYTKKGTYELKMEGRFSWIFLGFNQENADAITEIKYIGNMGVQALDITGGVNLTYLPLANMQELNAFSLWSYTIEEIPENLFEGAKNVEQVNFMGCKNLKTISEKVFEPISKTLTNIDRMFEGCTSLEGEVPEFWDKYKYPNITSHTDWLKGVDTTKITNYNDIPAEWK